MCVYSMVMDDWNRRNGQAVEPLITGDYFKIVTDQSSVTKRDLEDLRDEFRKELRSLKKLLKAAAQYDDESGQPDCEQEEKIALIRKLAAALEVDMEDCLPKKRSETPTLLNESALSKSSTSVVTTVASTNAPAFSDNVSWVVCDSPRSE